VLRSMEISAIIIGTWCALLFFISTLITLASIQNWRVASPFMAVSGLAVVFSLMGIRSSRRRSFVYWPAALCCGFLYVPCLFVMNHWRGGESDAGWAWQYLMGIGSLLALVTSAASVFAVIVSRLVKYAKST
jgi:hypothetical protein